MSKPMSVPKRVKDLMSNLTESVSTEAEEIVKVYFPEKISRLHALLDKPEFKELTKEEVAESAQLPDLTKLNSDVQSEQQTSSAGSTDRSAKRQRGDNGARPTGDGAEPRDEFGNLDWTLKEGGKEGTGPNVPSNKWIIAMMDILRDEVKEAVSKLGIVKMWVQLMVPRIEDGNNFGVEVQEEIISELSRIEDASFQVLETLSRYFETRSRLIEKYIKHPRINDYRQAILEHDEMEIVTLRMCAVDLRNNYTVLLDMINKNLDRVKRPRGAVNAMESMY